MNWTELDGMADTVETGTTGGNYLRRGDLVQSIGYIKVTRLKR